MVKYYKSKRVLNIWELKLMQIVVLKCQVIDDLSIKLTIIYAFLKKVRQYVSPKILTSIYFAIFESYLLLSCLGSEF